VAVSRAHPGVYWTHADSGEPWVWAVDSAGARVGRVRLAGTTVVDWEDIELAECGDVDCLYVADTGDNSERRTTVRVHRLLEPDPATDTIVPAETFELRLPDGPRDIEALFVLPGERLHLVTKGRNHAVSVYRYPGALRAGSTVEVEEVQRLGDELRALPRQVTAASADREGARVAVRTYETVTFFRVEADTLAPVEDGPLNLRTLRETQGEGVGVGEDGLVVLTSEAGPLGQRGSIALVRCAG
jgi:hypothetical protein